jgi:hypothetical protein
MLVCVQIKNRGQFIEVSYTRRRKLMSNVYTAHSVACYCQTTLVIIKGQCVVEAADQKG